MADADSGQRSGVTTDDKKRTAGLERRSLSAEAANKFPEKSRCLFALNGLGYDAGRVHLIHNVILFRIESACAVLNLGARATRA